MSRLSRAAARCALRLVPAGRRDWAEGLLAEAGDVPPGAARLAWLAGGARLIAREARLVRLAALALVFAVAAGWIAHVGWPGPATNPGTGINRLNVVVLLPVLAVLPLLARWLFGPADRGRLARVLRAGAYAGVLVLLLAKVSVDPIADNPAATPYLNQDSKTPFMTGMVRAWLGQSLFLLIVTVCVAVILALTARRTRVATATLAVGAGAGLSLGAVLYAIFPIGFTSSATNPRLPGYAAHLLVALAWIVLFGGPLLAGAVAARSYRGPDTGRARIRQAAAAGFLATAAGALTVSVLGTATVALMPRAGWLMSWLYPGRHLTAATAYLPEVTASVRAGHYGLMLLFFPVIGLAMGLLAGVAATEYGTGTAGGPPLPSDHTPEPDPSATRT